MKPQLIAIVALGALLAACSQPADEPENAAVDTTPMQDEGTATGANSFSEDQARGAIENAGYTGVTGLMKGEDGIWSATATRDGTPAQVTVDYRGSVTPGTTPNAPPADSSAQPAAQ